MLNTLNMVRKKDNSTKKASTFAPSGKILMIERNRASLTPSKTPTSSKSPGLEHIAWNQSKSIHSSVSKKTKKRRVNQNIKALGEINKYQRSTKFLIPKLSFSRVVREVAQNILGKKNDIKFTALSLMALQEATEMAIVHLMEIANLCCIHAKRITVTPADVRLTRRAFGLANALNC